MPDKHSREIVDAFKAKGGATDLVMFPGAGHALLGADGEKAVATMVAWFEKHLAKAGDSR